MVAKAEPEIERIYQCPDCLTIETLAFSGETLVRTRFWKQVRGKVFHRECRRPSIELVMNGMDASGNNQLRDFLRLLMRDRRCLPTQLAAELGISHATVNRWLHGKAVPSPKYCWILSKYSGLPVNRILHIVGHLS